MKECKLKSADQKAQSEALKEVCNRRTSKFAEIAGLKQQDADLTAQKAALEAAVTATKLERNTYWYIGWEFTLHKLQKASVVEPLAHQV